MQIEGKSIRKNRAKLFGNQPKLSHSSATVRERVVFTWCEPVIKLNLYAPAFLFHDYIFEAYAETGKFDLADQHLKVLQSIDSKEADELAAFIAKMKDNG